MTVTGDDSVICALCGGETSLAMLFEHLVRKHSYDREELGDAILSAEIVDLTGEDE